MTVTPEIVVSGEWISPPVMMTPALARLALKNAVNVPFEEVPQQVKHYLTDEHGEYQGDPESALTITGYYYLTDAGAEELSRPNAFGLMVSLTSRESYFPIGQHTEGCPLPSLAEDGRLFAISYEDFLRLGGNLTPPMYLLGELGTDRRSDDIYLILNAA